MPVTDEQIKIIFDNTIKELQPVINNDLFYNNYIATLNFISSENNIINLCVKDGFAKTQINDKWIKKITDIFSAALKNVVQINLYLPNEPLAKTSISPTAYLKTNLNEFYTFDNYIVGDNNKDAVRMGRKYSDDTAPWNILFIAGAVGVGKTHLLHAIGNKYVSMVANKSVVFFNSDDIINNIYNTKKENDTDGIALQKLKTNFLQYDLMLVDDIQFFGKGKEGITEIFFNIFNKMVSTNKKIIVASDRNLEHLHGIDQRIISRLASGVTCIIEKPNVVAIKEIIKRKLATGTETFRLTDDALHFLASHTNGDIRKLDGTINTIIFHAINNYENNSILTTGDLQKILNTNAVEGNAHFNSSINPMFVIESICNDFNINVEAVISITRVAAFVRVRSICMYILKHKYKLTLNAIGSLFSNRSHTTVIEAIEKIEKQVKKNDEFANLVFRLMNKV